jgi:hypothetical protein
LSDPEKRHFIERLNAATRADLREHAGANPPKRQLSPIGYSGMTCGAGAGGMFDLRWE